MSDGERATDPAGMGNTAGSIAITGVSRGIGRSLAQAAARAGWRIAGLHRDPSDEVNDAISGELRDLGAPDCLIRSGDVRSTVDIDALADDAVSRWGSLDVWVNNAARLYVKPFLETTDEDWREVLDSNLLGYIRGARAAARHMVDAGSGHIINVSSAVFTLAPTDMSVYVTAKGGIAGLTRELAVELGPHGVRVNAVAPGATETPLNTTAWTDEVRSFYRRQIPMGYIAEPEDIADAIFMLAGDGSRYLTGQIVTVDGGLTLNGNAGHART